ncbi:MAG: metal ABC transporter solute-binding protein, Zn/Mn family [Bacteriovorax sp.]
MKIITTIILCLIGLRAHAGSTIFCAHSELCKMVNHIAHENNLTDIKTESLVNISGDPHEYEPSSAEIKNLLSAPVLLTGPSELNPWIKKINFQRSKISSLKTISLPFEKKDFLAYPKASGEALSHFWLYPKVYCSLKTKLEEEMRKSGYALKSSKACNVKGPEEELQKVLTKIKWPLILTHDALLPLLQELDKSHMIVAIKGSGHHEEAKPETIKRMYDALNAPQVIWVEETGITTPQNILNKIRSKDIVLKIDTANSKDDRPFSALMEMTEKLSSLIEKRP